VRESGWSVSLLNSSKITPKCVAADRLKRTLYTNNSKTIFILCFFLIVRILYVVAVF
jgi:hypothetical protein